MKHRLFLAVDLPPVFRSEIQALQHRLEPLNLPVIWESPEKLHLTLHFIGPTPHDQLVKLLPELHEFAHTHVSFELQPFFVETLYQRHEPSLIYIGFHGDLSPLKSLQKTLGQLLSQFRLSSQTRFLPHVTIGRLKRTDPVATKTFLGQLEDFHLTPFTPFIVDHFSLYESLVSRVGSHYELIGQYQLK